MTTTTTDLDQTALAADLTEVLAGPKYGLDIQAEHVSRALDAFLADVQGYAQEGPAT